MTIDRKRCSSCGQCAAECPTTALEVLGRSWALEDLVAEVTKDQSYFDSSGGGITLSGGEPAMQARFVKSFLKRLRGLGIHTALDTCGGYSRNILEPLLPYANLVLYDLKEMDPDQHLTFTGVALDPVLDNLFFLCRNMGNHRHPEDLWIRTPVIPGATAGAENIQAIGRLIAEQTDGRITRWELCAFNHLCRDKYTRLNMPWDFNTCPPMAQTAVDELLQVARKSGVDPAIVHWSGAMNKTAREEKP